MSSMLMPRVTPFGFVKSGNNRSFRIKTIAEILPLKLTTNGGASPRVPVHNISIC
jgi:hypothetical protein